MPRRLLIANLILAAIAAGAVLYIVREVTTPPRPMPLRARAANPEPPAPAPPTTSPGISPGGFAVVASKNLFSPTRTEAPGPTAQQRAVANLPKPTLHGVVVREGAPIAYLEDPMTKRIAGYRLGDAVAGGTVQTIDADHVVLARPEGQVDVRLRDPAKPRSAAAPAGQVPPAPVTPGVPVPAVPPPGVTTEGAVPPQTPQVQVPPRRMLPPNLLRRVPPTTSDATP